MLVKGIAKQILPSSFLDFFRATRQRWHLQEREAIAAKQIKQLQQDDTPIQLELGAFKPRQGWITVDLTEGSDLFLDLSQPIPFPDGSVAHLYSSHMLEHFYYHDLLDLLAECYRILKPGGSFKVAVPNARIYLEAYFNPQAFDASYYCTHKLFHYNSKIDYVNYMAYMGGDRIPGGGHRYMFDEENLVLVLSNAGFKSVKLREFEPSLDSEEKRYESIYAEGFKL